MYSRSSGMGRMRVPSNYSGSAFERGGYADMPPPAVREPRRRADGVGESEMHGLGNREDEGERRTVETDLPMREIGGAASVAETGRAAESQTRSVSQGREDGGSLLSSLIPPQVLAGAFPFAHGIGSEEILIFALMLAVYLSGAERGEADGELILLLGLLLFAG